MKRYIVVDHHAKEFANRLWSDMSVYAFALESGARFYSLASLEHTPLRFLHTALSRCLDILTRSTSALWAINGPKNLPPSTTLPEKYGRYNTLYFFGWLFKNPEGFIKHRDALRKKFAPPEAAHNAIALYMHPLAGKTVIGIHVRQKPFRGFEDGEFLVSLARVRTIVNEYVLERHLSIHDVALVVVSDLEVPAEIFAGYDVVPQEENQEVGFYMLAQCSVIIGTNTTFANLAAWFADAPHIVIKNETIDWAYYRDKTTYFENKYANFLQ